MSNPTQASIHAPKRFDGETQAQYRERRAKSKAAVERMTLKGLTGGIGARQQFRDAMRRNGTMGKRERAYKSLMAAWASKRVTKAPLRDKHGAYTLVGAPYEIIAAEGEAVTPNAREHVLGGALGNGGHTEYMARRKWLAGISAQRGF